MSASGISYDTKEYVVSLRHPRQVRDNERMKFKLCSSDVGTIASDAKSRSITDLEQEMGIGMTLYLRQMKFFAVMFFAFTVLSAPSFLLYNSGSQNKSGGYS